MALLPVASAVCPKATDLSPVAWLLKPNEVLPIPDWASCPIAILDVPGPPDGEVSTDDALAP